MGGMETPQPAGIDRFGSKEEPYGGSGEGGCLQPVAGWRWEFSPGLLQWEKVTGGQPGIGDVTRTWGSWGLGSPMPPARTIEREGEPSASAACNFDVF